MSQKYYTKIWTEALEKLKKVVNSDRAVVNDGPYTDSAEAKFKIAILYIRYAQISNKLCEASDEIRDPLIAAYVRKYYEITVSRALQLNDELSRLLAENAINLNYELVRVALTPFDIRLRIPAYYLEQRQDDLQKWKILIDNLWLAYADEESLETEDISEFGDEDIVSEESNVFENVSEKVMICSEIEKEKVFIAKNREIQKKELSDFVEMCREAEERVLEVYKERFMEDVEDELREWCLDFYNTCHAFPPFPPSEPVHVTGKTYGIPKNAQDYFSSNLADDFPKNAFTRDFCGVMKLGGSALIPAGSWISPEVWLACQNVKKSSTKKKLPKKSKKKEKGFELKRTEFFSIMELLRNGDCCNASAELAESNAFYKNRFEIRKEVDVDFRIELDLLEAALYKDKFPKRKRRKVKEGKPKKGKIGKDVSTEECIQELLQTGVFRLGYGAQLKDYVTDFDYTGKTCCGKLIDLLLQRCIIPLSSSAVHQLSPLTRSICLMGPEHSGKRFLIDAIITATGAAVFDISPEVTSIYSKKQSKRMIALIRRLSSELQPSIIFLPNIERIFSKKVAANDKQLKPKQLAPFIRKLVKGIKAHNQVLLMATSSQPWLAKPKKLIQCIDRFFYVPTTDYGSHVQFWEKLLNGSQFTPALAKVSSQQGYRYQDIAETVCYGGSIDELVAKPQFDGKKFDKFLKRTPQGKAKQKILAGKRAKK